MSMCMSYMVIMVLVQDFLLFVINQNETLLHGTEYSLKSLKSQLCRVTMNERRFGSLWLLFFFKNKILCL